MSECIWALGFVLLIEGVFSPIRDIVLAWKHGQTGNKPEITAGQMSHPEEM